MALSFTLLSRSPDAALPLPGYPTSSHFGVELSGFPDHPMIRSPMTRSRWPGHPMTRSNDSRPYAGLPDRQDPDCAASPSPLPGYPTASHFGVDFRGDPIPRSLPPDTPTRIPKDLQGSIPRHPWSGSKAHSGRSRSQQPVADFSKIIPQPIFPGWRKIAYFTIYSPFCQGQNAGLYTRQTQAIFIK
jgi:hypothetical protein